MRFVVIPRENVVRKLFRWRTKIKESEEVVHVADGKSFEWKRFWRRGGFAEPVFLLSNYYFNKPMKGNETNIKE